jgi:hypothetical protein
MRSVRKAIVKTGLLVVALLPLAAAVSTTEAAPEHDPAGQPRVTVAIAQPLAAIDTPLVARGTGAMISESGMLILVGSALLGLASVVRRTTRADGE